MFALYTSDRAVDGVFGKGIFYFYLKSMGFYFVEFPFERSNSWDLTALLYDIAEDLIYWDILDQEKTQLEDSFFIVSMTFEAWNFGIDFEGKFELFLFHYLSKMDQNRGQ